MHAKGEAMTTKTEQKNTPPELRMTRVFDAPRALVFEAWTKTEYVSRWFTPAPLTTPACEVDFRPGGVFRVVMRMPDGLEHPMDAKFLEIEAPSRIVFAAKLADGNEIWTEVKLTEHGGKTTLDVHQTYTLETNATRGATMGWEATLNQLGEHVKTRAATS
jgi:uncharacterized protein YndB with AHSA1/START domain